MTLEIWEFPELLGCKVNTFMLLFKRLLLPFAWSMAITEIELHINLFFFSPLTHHPWTAQSYIVCCAGPFYSRCKHRWDGTTVTGHTLSQLWCWLPYWPLEDSESTEYWERNWNFSENDSFSNTKTQHNGSFWDELRNSKDRKKWQRVGSSCK